MALALFILGAAMIFCAFSYLVIRFLDWVDGDDWS